MSGVVIVIVVALVAACSGPRSGASVTGDVSGCAAVLPLARSIVHDQGTLTLIRRINQTDADALAHQLGVINPTASPSPYPRPRGPHLPTRARSPKTCLIVYQGNYPPGTIIGASQPAVAGHYALMVLRVRHPAIERVLVTDRLPPHLNRHRLPLNLLRGTF